MSRRIAGKVAPRAARNVTELNAAREQLAELALTLAALRVRIEALETGGDELREEIDETRRDGRRVAELYDLVFERLRAPQD